MDTSGVNPEVRASDAPPARTVMVAAASRHGSTAAIAARIGRVMQNLLSDVWDVQVVDLADPPRWEDADAVVLGSAIYLGRWLRPAVTALRAVKDAPLLDLWLFSTGPVSAETSENTSVITADEAVASGCAAEHMVFAGRLDVAQLSWWERLMVRAVGVVSGDRRDWDQVDGWAASIAAELSAAVIAPEVRHESP